MEHISVNSWRNPINLYTTEKLIKFSKSHFYFYLVISNKWGERTPYFPTFVFPFGVPSRTCCVWWHQLLHFHIWHCLQSKTVSAFFERPLCLYFIAKTPKWHFRNRKRRSFIVITWKVFRISKKHWYGLKLLLCSYKTAKFQISGRKTARVGTSSVSQFCPKNSLEKKAFKSFGAPSNPLPVKFFWFKISLSVWDITILFR